jgi:8-oxo-dGTP diphosphatase
MTKHSQKYKHAVIASDIVIFTIQGEQLKALLIKMKKAPYQNMWAAPGGLVRGSESVEDAARRILLDKTGVKNVYLEQLYTFGDVDRDPFGRVVSVAYFALIPYAGLSLKTTAEYGGVAWFPVENLPKLAYDHSKIVRTAVQRLRSKLEYSNIIYHLMPKEFTLSELQQIYEIILGRSLDKRNFRKKLLSLQIVKKLRKKRKGDAHRPAELYCFMEHTPQTASIL